MRLRVGRRLRGSMAFIFSIFVVLAGWGLLHPEAACHYGLGTFAVRRCRQWGSCLWMASTHAPGAHRRPTPPTTVGARGSYLSTTSHAGARWAFALCLPPAALHPRWAGRAQLWVCCDFGEESGGVL